MASASAQRLASIYSAGQLANAGAVNQGLITAGYDHATDDLNTRTAEGMTALDDGLANATGKYNSAIALYDPYVAAGQKATSTYNDALGLNGAEGNANAVSTYQTSPGYQAAVDAATDGVARKASALGVLGSGNTMQAISTKAQDLQNQDYGSWEDRLKGVSDQGYSATGAQASLTKGIGDLDMSEGTGKASLYSGLGSALAGVDTGEAGALANNNMAVATGQSSAVTNAAQATDAAKNANENLLLGIAGLGTNLLTGKSTATNAKALTSGFGSIFG